MTSRTILCSTVLTLFPDMFPGPLGVSLAGKALSAGLWALEARDIRDSATDRHRSVDDTPAGGGPGMVLKPEPMSAAIDAAAARAPAGSPRVYMSAQGAPFTQAMAREWSAGPGLIVFCGRFEALDERVIEARGMREICVGDAVLAGGEAAAGGWSGARPTSGRQTWHQGNLPPSPKEDLPACWSSGTAIRGRSPSAGWWHASRSPRKADPGRNRIPPSTLPSS